MIYRCLALVGLVMLTAACASVEDTDTLPTNATQDSATYTETELAAGITAIADAPPLTVVELLNQDNEPLALNALQGRYVFFTFGYTHCPDVCPLTLAEMRRVHDLLAAQGKADRVQLVFISVDGKRDTPEKLKQHLSYFNADIIGLTGTREQAEALISQFGGVFNINDVAGAIKDYTVDHTAGTFLLDPSGAWVRRYAYRTDPQLIAEDLLTRLKI